MYILYYIVLYCIIYGVKLLSGPSLALGYYLVQVGVIIWSNFVSGLYLQWFQAILYT